MILDHFDRGDLAAGDHGLHGHRAFLAVDSRGVFAVSEGRAHIELGAGSRFLHKQLVRQHIGSRLDLIALGELHGHRVARSDLAEDDRAHNAGAGRDKLAPHAADGLAGRIQARDHIAGLIEDLHVLVRSDAAKRHDAQRLERNGIELIALDLVDGDVVGILGAIIETAELIGRAAFDSRIVGFDSLHQILRRNVDLRSEFLKRGGGIHHVPARLTLSSEVSVIEIRLTRSTQIFDDLIGEDIVLDGFRLALKGNLAHGRIGLSLVAEALAVLVDDDTAGLPGIGVGDRAGLRVILADQAHREGRNGIHRSQARADFLHHADAVAVRAGSAASQIVVAIRNELRHQLAVGRVAAGGDDNTLGSGVGFAIVGLNAQHLALVIGHKLDGLGVQLHLDHVILRDQAVEHLVRGGLVVRLVFRARLIGTLDGEERMLRREHRTVAGGAVDGVSVVLQAGLIEPVEYSGRLVGVNTHERLIGLSTQIAADAQDIRHIILHAVLHALFLLDDGARSGHGAAGVVQRTAGLGGHFQHDDLLRALGRSLQRSRQAAAARADHDHISIGALGKSREHEAGHQHRQDEQQGNQLVHVVFLLFVVRCVCFKIYTNVRARTRRALTLCHELLRNGLIINQRRPR